jgi:hypothetical protein
MIQTGKNTHVIDPMRSSVCGKTPLISITITCEYIGQQFLRLIISNKQDFLGALSNLSNVKTFVLKSFFSEKCLWLENLLVSTSANGHVVRVVFSALTSLFSVKVVECGTMQNVIAFLKPI